MAERRVGGRPGPRPQTWVLRFTDGRFYAGDDTEPVDDRAQAHPYVGREAALEDARTVVALWGEPVVAVRKEAP